MPIAKAERIGTARNMTTIEAQLNDLMTAAQRRQTLVIHQHEAEQASRGNRRDHYLASRSARESRAIDAAY